MVVVVGMSVVVVVVVPGSGDVVVVIVAGGLQGQLPTGDSVVVVPGSPVVVVVTGGIVVVVTGGVVVGVALQLSVVKSHLSVDSFHVHLQVPEQRVVGCIVVVVVGAGVGSPGSSVVVVGNKLVVVPGGCVVGIDNCGGLTFIHQPDLVLLIST